LIYPPSKTQGHTDCPLGILMLAAVLGEAGYDVRILDANAQNNRKNVEGLVLTAESIKPDIIGMTLLTSLIREAYDLASKLKSPDVKLLAGGPHATILPEEALANGFDAVVEGEGEAVIVEAVEALLGLRSMEDVPGWRYIDGEGRIKRTGPKPPIIDLDSLPSPARHLVSQDDYGGRQNPSLFSCVLTSRGCPARCSFCSGTLFGKKFRPRSAENILDEIFHTQRSYGTRHFHFTDDTTTMNSRRMISICEGLIEKRLDIEWSLMTRIDTVSEDLLSHLSRAGCTEIHYGIESGHPETLRRIHKPHTVEIVRRRVPLTAEMGIKPILYFIVGFPWEGPEAIQATLNLMEELSPYVGYYHPAIASVLVPFPGTEIYEEHKKQYGFENWWLTSDWNYDVPRKETHSYMESKIFIMGSVLDADFFDYSKEAKKKIIEVFKFMYLHNIRIQKSFFNPARKALLELSDRLQSFSPRLERMVFTPLQKLRRKAWS